MNGGIYLTIKDLQILLGCDNYKSAARHHQCIRKNMNKESNPITIEEYCLHHQINFQYVWGILRGKNGIIYKD